MGTTLRDTAQKKTLHAENVHNNLHHGSVRHRLKHALIGGKEHFAVDKKCSERLRVTVMKNTQLKIC